MTVTCSRCGITYEAGHVCMGSETACRIALKCGLRATDVDNVITLLELEGWRKS